MNRLRFRSGQVQLSKVRVDANTLIDAGDLVFLDVNDAKPANKFPWNTDLATTQSDFAESFLGVAHQQSGDGDSEAISIDFSPHALYEFDVDPSSYEVGDILGPDEDNTDLMNQQLEAVSSGTRGIARSTEYKINTVSRLRVAFASAFHTGSANANAAIG